jgi:membrane protease YdiL (CAAX protease family)
MLSYIFLLIILALVVWGIVSDKKDFARFKHASGQNRLKFYQNWFKKSWIFGVIGLSGLIATGAIENLWAVDSEVGIGSSIWTDFVSGFAYGIIGGLCLIILFRATQRKFSDGKSKQIRAQASSIGDMLAMVPCNKTERKWGTLLAVAAGFNEEILFRALLLSILVGILGTANVLIAAVIAVMLFGLMHSYQGITGKLTSMLTGGILMAAYLCTGNIFVPILIHFLIDFQSLTISSLVFERAKYRSADHYYRSSHDR